MKTVTVINNDCDLKLQLLKCYTGEKFVFYQKGVSQTSLKKLSRAKVSFEPLPENQEDYFIYFNSFFKEKEVVNFVYTGKAGLCEAETLRAFCKLHFLKNIEVRFCRYGLLTEV